MAWDSETDRLKREKSLAEQRAIVEKHQRSLAAMLNIAVLPTKVLLTRMGTPEFEAELARTSALGLLREALRANAAVPSLILAERAAHGLSTAEIVVEERRAELERERAVADAIAADPRLVDLAVELLDGIAKPPTDSGQ
jgi:hypothetical protein